MFNNQKSRIAFKRQLLKLEKLKVDISVTLIYMHIFFDKQDCYIIAYILIFLHQAT